MVARAWGYSLQTDASGVYVIKWEASPVTMVVKLDNTPSLLDGHSLRSSVVAAMEAWNAELGTVQFAPSLSSPGNYANGNGVNEVIIDSTLDGDQFPAGTLAITASYVSGNEMAESDVVFNSAYVWESYRGSLRTGLQDIHRVALHEFGHVLGLDHPDQDGQSVTAVMNSHISSVDRLRTDDIAGGVKLYGPPGVVQPNDAFASATVITLADGAKTMTGSNLGATRETGEPEHADGSGIHSVWWKWTAAANATVTLTTLGSNFDTVLAVYTGTRVDALTEVVSNDDEETPEEDSTPRRRRSSKATFSAVSGRTYHIAVDGWGDDDRFPNGYTGSITLKLDVDVLTPPAITNVTALSVDVGAPFTYNIVATREPESFSASGLPTGLTLASSTGLISGRPTKTGTFAVQLGATNAAGTGRATLALTVKAAAPAVTAQPTGVQVLAPGGSLTMAFSVISANGTPTYQWRHNGRLIAGATRSSLVLSSGSWRDRGYYQVAITNTIGTTHAVVFVRFAPTRTEFVGWGRSTEGQLSPPANATRGVDLAANENLVVQLGANGTVASWGSTQPGRPATVPAGLVDVAMVAAGTSHSLILRADGTVHAWGDNNRGQNSVPAGLGNVVTIAAGGSHSLAVKSDGTVVAWGWNEFGQCNVPAGLDRVVAVAGGASHSLALRSDGTVVAWGYNTSGQSTVPSGLTGVTAVSAGETYSLALKSDGTVVAWGMSPAGTSVPAGLNQVTAITAGAYHSLALKIDGSVVAWGDGEAGGTTVPAGLNKVIALAAGEYFSAVLRDASTDTAPVITAGPAGQNVIEGAAASFAVTASNGGAMNIQYQWRRNGQPVAGATGPSFTLASTTPADAGIYDVVVTNVAGSTTSGSTTLVVRSLPGVVNQTPLRQTVKPGSTLTFRVTATGTGTVRLQWYRNGLPISGATGATYTRVANSGADAGVYWAVATDSVGRRHGAPFFALLDRAAGTVATNVVGWGSDVSGQTDVPDAARNVMAIAAGGDTAAGLKPDGTVVAWGANGIRFPNWTNVVAVSVGGDRALALRADGTVAAVVTAGDTTPVPAGLGNVAAIAAGESVALALKTDGTVVTWVGDVPPAGLQDVVAVGAGVHHALAVRRDGTVAAWGRYTAGGSVSPPAGLSNAIAVVGGMNHSMALRSNGSVVVWGSTGANIQEQANVPGAALSGVVAIASGFDHCLALKADGTVVAWGAAGNLKSSVPPGLRSVFAIAAGGHSSFAARTVTPAEPPLIATEPVSQNSGINGNISFQVTAGAATAPTFQWQRNGQDIPGATSSSYSIIGTQPADAGIYTAVITSGTTVTSAPAVLAVASSDKVAGSGSEIASDIVHPNGNQYDQVLLQGTAAIVKSNPGQVTRLSFIDLSDDIVQVEFSGPGSLSISLDAATGPAAPLNYVQPGAAYMKGHATLIISEATADTHVSVFSVGRANAVNPALFRDDIEYDGVADLAAIAILSSTGEFGGVRTANASYFDTRNLTGIYAPGVRFTGPIYIGEIGARDNATPVIRLGSAAGETQINGGDLLQPNGRPVQVSGLTQLRFVAGSTSHGGPLPAAPNQGRLEEEGVDVTAEVVVNPVP